MSRAHQPAPVFTHLDDSECRAILYRNHLGRIAFLNGREADIVPVTYAATGDWIYVRSADGAKVEAFGHNPFVALEVEEVRSASDWRSVVAHGTIYFLSNEGPESQRNAYSAALAALREIAPEALTSSDPTPSRQIVYGIHVDRCTGRMATSDPPEASTSNTAASSSRKVPRTTDGS